MQRAGPVVAQESPACLLCPHGSEQLHGNVALQPRHRALDSGDRDSQTLTVQVSRWTKSKLQGVCEEPWSWWAVSSLYWRSVIHCELIFVYRMDRVS